MPLHGLFISDLSIILFKHALKMHAICSNVLAQSRAQLVYYSTVPHIDQQTRK